MIFRIVTTVDGVVVDILEFFHADLARGMKKVELFVINSTRRWRATFTITISPVKTQDIQL